jgi:hypothetical protein
VNELPEQPSFGKTQRTIDSNMQRLSQYVVSQAGRNRHQYEVTRRDSNDATQHVVDTRSHTCTCGLPQVVGWPCVHVCAVVDQDDCDVAISSFLARGLRLRDLKSAYSYNIHPIAVTDVSNDSLRPPASLPVARGRPSKRRAAAARIPSRGESKRVATKSKVSVVGKK